MHVKINDRMKAPKKVHTLHYVLHATDVICNCNSNNSPLTLFLQILALHKLFTYLFTYLNQSLMRRACIINLKIKQIQVILRKDYKDISAIWLLT